MYTQIEGKRKTMATTDEVRLVIRSEVSEALSGMKKVLDQMKKVEEQQKKSNSTSLAAVKGIGLQAAAFLGLSTTLGGLFEAVKQEELAFAQMQAVLQSTGYAAGMTSEELDNMSKQLQRTTLFGDEVIMTGQNMLMTFTNIGKDVFPQATMAMLDMSQALGQDVKNSAIQLGKALNDPIQGATALRRVGIQLNEQQQQQIKTYMELGQIQEAQKVILGELATEFGGSATRAAQTFTGQIQQLINRSDDFLQAFGTPISRALADSGASLMAFGDIVEGVAANLGNVIASIINLYSQYRPTLDKIIEASEVVMLPLGYAKTVGKGAMAASSGIKKMLEIQESQDVHNLMYDEQGNRTGVELSDIDPRLAEKTKAAEGAKKAATRKAGITVSGSGEAAEKHAEEVKKAIDEINLYYGDKDDQLEEREMQKYAKLVEMTKKYQADMFSSKEEMNSELELMETQHQANLEAIREEANEKERQEMANKITEYAGMASQVVNSLQGTFSAYYNYQFGMMDREKAKKAADIKANIKDEAAQKAALEKLDEEYAEKKKKLQRQQAEQQKVLSLMQAIISTAQAVAMALTAGPIAGPILAGIVGAMGAAQIALIAATPIPEMAKGGIIQGSPSGQIIRAGESGRSEAIIPLEDDRAMEQLGGIGGGTHIHIHVDNLFADDETAARRMADAIDKELFKMKQDKRSRAFA